MNKREKSSNGFSLVELIVAMTVLMIIIPSIVGIAHSASAVKTGILQSNKNLVNSSAFDQILRSDIENASEIVITENSNRLRLRKNDNTCKDWRLDSATNELRYVSKSNVSITASVPTSSNWNTYWYKISTDESPNQVVKTGKSGNTFVYENGVVTYDIGFGTDEKIEYFKGSIQQKAISQPSSLECW